MGWQWGCSARWGFGLLVEITGIEVIRFQGIRIHINVRLRHEITSECIVDVNVGLDHLRIDIADPGGRNQALVGKKCDAGVDLARQAAAEIRK